MRDQDGVSFCWLCVCLLVLLTGWGCSSRALLPSSQDTVRSPWGSFAAVKADFDRITPYQTTLDGLRQLRFTPEASPNVQILNHLDLMQRFLPNPSLSLADLAPGLKDCLTRQELCQAFEINLRTVDAERYGNVFLDLFNFRRRTAISGWEFRAIIVMKDQLVVHTLCGGKPNIDEDRDRRNPLGPLQSFENAESILWDAAR